MLIEKDINCHMKIESTVDIYANIQYIYMYIYMRLLNETLQLCYNHRRYLMKKIIERKQFLSQRLPHIFQKLNECLASFHNQK